MKNENKTEQIAFYLDVTKQIWRPIDADFQKRWTRTKGKLPIS